MKQIWRITLGRLTQVILSLSLLLNSLNPVLVSAEAIDWQVEAKDVAQAETATPTPTDLLTVAPSPTDGSTSLPEASTTPQVHVTNTPTLETTRASTTTPMVDGTATLMPTNPISPTSTPTQPTTTTVEAEIPVAGGEVVFGNNHELKLKFRDKSVKKPIKVVIMELRELPKNLPFEASLTGYAVEINLRNVDDNQEIRNTDLPVTVTLKTRDLWPSLNPASFRLLAFYHYDEIKQNWERILTDGDPITGVMTATLSSFSPIAVGGSPQTSVGDFARPWQPSIGSYSIDKQMGTVGWTIPIEAPAGRGGLVPNLALVYNTGTVDELRGTSNPQTPNIGMGWSLNVPYIERVVQWDPNNLYNTPQASVNPSVSQ